MSQYIVSARKYRPDSFESLIGQDNIVQTLKNSIIRGQLAHAYLFCGPRGVGKTSAARIFAKTINCAHPSADMEPCGECESCVSFREGRSYCIHELDAASNNGVDDIKALIDQVNIPPQVGRYSVYIVDEVHMLSQAAFNAFLKTLEEPPAHAIFILATTEKHKILPTILSRCQTYDFNRISIPDIVSNLREIAGKENISIDDESLHIIAQKADGAMRDALTIFDQTVAFCGTNVKYEDVIRNLNVLDYEHCFQLVDDFLAGDYAASLLKFDEILSKGFNALHFVSALSSHLRDLLVAGSGGMDSLLELPKSLKDKYKEQSSRCPLQFLYDALSITTACEAGYRASINPRLHIEFALMKLSFLSGGQVSVKSPVMKDNAPVASPSKSNLVTRPSANAEVTQVATVPAKAENIAKNATTSSNAEGSAKALSPAAAEEPVARARRHSTKGSAVSLSAVKEADQAQNVAEEVLAAQDAPIPEDEDIKAGWNKLIQGYQSRPRLLVTLQGAKLEIKATEDHKDVTFFVINTAQRDWIREKLLREMEAKLQSLVLSAKLRLSVETLPEDEVERKVYTPEEQARDLRGKNPEVDNLIKTLDLEVRR